MEANVRYWLRENALYVKAGRMYLPFGYRFEDDNAFVRQLSGINMQAPDEGVEFGLRERQLERAGRLQQRRRRRRRDRSRQAGRHARRVRAVGLARRREPALQRHRCRRRARARASSARSTSGPVTLLGEVDFIDDESIGDGKLLATLAEADWKLAQGHNLKLTYEWFEPNDDVDEDEQIRTSLLYEWSPIQFIQLRAGVRVYDGIPQNDNQNRKQAFLQLHGFF